MLEIPGIIEQRWAAAAADPSIPQWRSLGQWYENFAEQCEAHPETRHHAARLRELADEAYRNMKALQPVEEAA